MKIVDLCAYAPKSAIKAGEAIKDGKYMFFTSSDDESKRYSDYQHNCEAIIMGTGGNATLHYYNGKFSTSTDCIVLLPNESIRCKFLYYFFLHNIAVLEKGFKGAGLKHTNKNYINNIEINTVPDIETQDKVIKALDLACNLVRFRQRQLKKLDELVKSRFIELFGDMESNPKGWRESTLGTECYYIKYGPHKSPPYIDDQNGIPFISTRNIVNGDGIDWSTAKYISEADCLQCIKKCKPEKGDILYSKGGTTGIAKYVDTDKRFANWVHVAVLKFGDQLDGRFLERMLNMDYCYRQSQQLTKGIANRDFVLSAIAQVKIFVPPIELQRQYVRFVEQTDKSKLAIQQSIEKLETLKKALMQQYFG